MKNYADFLADIMPDLPGADQALLIHETRRTVVDFCQGSWVHNATQSFDTVAGVPDYAIDIPAGHVVADVLYLKVGDAPIPPTTEFVLDAERPTWRNAAAGEVTGYLLSADRATITMVDTPSDVRPCALRVAFKPSRASVQCQDFLLEQYGEVIACGTKARLFRMPKKPWTNLNLAVALRLEYDAAKGAAKMAAQMNHTIASLSVGTLLEY